MKWFNSVFQNYRYIVVCRPLHAKSMCTLRRTRIAIVFVCLFALAYNTSRLLEYKTDTRDANNASRSSVSCFDLFQLLQPIRYININLCNLGIIIIFLFQIYKTVFVNDTMIENEENSIKRYREKYSQLIEHYKNLRNESISDAGFPPDLFMKESLDVLGKYPVINYITVYPFQITA